MGAATRRLDRTRAGGFCEYCRIRQDDEVFTHHIEPILPQPHGGTDEAVNLALGCHYCNRHKGPNLAGIDTLTKQLTRLFHPRRDA